MIVFFAVTHGDQRRLMVIEEISANTCASGRGVDIYRQMKVELMGQVLFFYGHLSTVVTLVPLPLKSVQRLIHIPLAPFWLLTSRHVSDFISHTLSTTQPDPITVLHCLALPRPQPYPSSTCRHWNPYSWPKIIFFDLQLNSLDQT